MKQLSSGEKKELLVIQFASGIIKTSMLSERQDGLINLLEGHMLTSVIKDASVALDQRLSATFKNNIDSYSATWFKSKLKSKISPLLHKLDKEKVELLSFSIYLLYRNFSDLRNKSLSDRFKEYEDPQQYFYILDMIDEVRGKEGNDMFDLAVYCIDVLKA